jgi:hypothetical protein
LAAVADVTILSPFLKLTVPLGANPATDALKVTGVSDRFGMGATPTDDVDELALVQFTNTTLEVGVLALVSNFARK